MPADFKKAAESAKLRGLVHLEEMFLRMDKSLNAPEPAARPAYGRKRISFVYYNPGWCDGRLSRELASHLTDYDTRFIDHRAMCANGKDYMHFDDDIYLFRNAGRVGSLVPPEWAKKKTICMIESDRALDANIHIKIFNEAAVVVAQNEHLRDRARSLGITTVIDTIIANGINCDEFYPSEKMPEEFTVGVAGNFSIEAFDHWKGFSRYIIPACARAGVRLKWCGWKGQAALAPGMPGEQVPLDKMGDWYRSISCLVSMSVSEGCSGVVFESMASGIPVISTKVGWHGDNCSEISDGIIWQDRPKDETSENIEKTISELSDKLVMLKGLGPDALRKIGSGGRAFAEKWPHSRIADQWREVFSAMLSKTANYMPFKCKSCGGMFQCPCGLCAKCPVPHANMHAMEEALKKRDEEIASLRSSLDSIAPSREDDMWWLNGTEYEDR